MTWVVHDIRRGFEVTVEYATGLFAPGTIARLVQHWFTLLEQALAAPDQPLSTLALLLPAERKRVIIEWNETSRPYPEESLAQLFERQVEARPDAVAVQYGETELTYAGLNRRANVVADRLHQLGVGREVIVALCTER